MRKLLLLIIVLVFVLTMAASPVMRLSRFTVVNKSGGPISMRLVPITSQSQQTYYLNVVSGDRDFPATAVYTVQMNRYDVLVFFYKETVKGSVITTEQICAMEKYPDLTYYPPTVDLTHNNKITVLPCNQRNEPVSLGSDGYWKYWYPSYVNYSDRPEPTFKRNWVPEWKYIY